MNFHNSLLAVSGIRKVIPLQELRHPFATHLREIRRALRYIRELPGRKRSKITEIYTLVIKKNSHFCNSLNQKL
jgi:site-specific recombinase XerD